MGEYLSAKVIQKEQSRKFHQISFTSVAELSSAAAKKQLVSVIDGIPQGEVTKDSVFVVSEDHSSSILFNQDHADAWLEALEDQGHIRDFYIVASRNGIFDEIKERINELLGPIIITEEEKRPMSEGLIANMDHFRLDFLDRGQVEIGGKLADILPALWMMAGCRGNLPTCSGKERMLFFKACPFAILVDESHIKPFLEKLQERSDIDWVFLLTNDQDSFSLMCEWLPENVPATQRIHLWRNYVDNFLINIDRT
jgi:adenine-specific DNA-methyltransferase